MNASALLSVPGNVPPATVGRQFGRYRLGELLGTGGMARVYRAEQEGPRGFRRDVALKILTLSDGEPRSLLDEAMLGARLTHPNLVTIHDYGEVDGREFIAMERVDGPTLASALRIFGPPPPAAALSIAAQLCEALTHLHELEIDGHPAGLVHRDVKPSNVLISSTGVIKLADLGIAKATFLATRHTATDLTRGTPAYMSPEQLHADPLDHRSDLFSFGVLLVELLTGRPLFEGRSAPEIMMAVAGISTRLEDPVFPAGVEEVLPGSRALLRVCLTPDRSNRWTSAAALGEVLAILGPDGGPAAVRAWLDGPEAPSRSARRRQIPPTLLATPASLSDSALSPLTEAVPPASAAHAPRAVLALASALLIFGLGFLLGNRQMPPPPSEVPGQELDLDMVHHQEVLVVDASSRLQLQLLATPAPDVELRLHLRLPGGPWSSLRMAEAAPGRWIGQVAVPEEALGTAAYFFRATDPNGASSTLGGPEHPWRFEIVPAAHPSGPHGD